MSSIRPPRPKAIATFLSSRDFLPGCQALLHSVRSNLPPKSNDHYPPELIVLLSSKLHNDASVTDRLRLFCTRIIEVEHIPINSKDEGGATQNNKSNEVSHVKEWDQNCGWTKLRLFELDGYDTILYIDADCLVLKDVSHLLCVDESDGKDGNRVDQTKITQENRLQRGLLAAAPDIFPPDKFNAGVMVLRPSKEVFLDMMSRLPQDASVVGDNDSKCKSYDGGDTGFLNSYYPDWYRTWPSYSRLSFGYNAQRLMYHYTQKRPQYWDEGIDSLYIVHYSSSPKPWEAMMSAAVANNIESPDYLTAQDKNAIQRLMKSGKLENMWQAAYERSQKYFLKEKREQLASAQLSKKAQCRTKPTTPASSSSARNQNEAKLFNKRFKEMRDQGMSMEEAMKKARLESGLDKMDNIDPRKAVGQMFGLR
jgi:glycogenin glucosyltransferase